MRRLHAMIGEHALADQVSVLGRVPEDELLGHLRGSDVLIHLSSIDSYPLIVLEAMACSVTPVVLELAGARDMVDTYGGHVVQRCNAVGDTVEWLRRCDLAALRKTRADIARRVRADYAWPRCSAALAAALEACLSHPG
jgi:glycosyltransferase involved in cell wall biosynthesis